MLLRIIPLLLQNFHEWLKDGQVLCQLMNALRSGSCKPNPPGTSSIAVKSRFCCKVAVIFLYIAILYRF